MKAVADTTMKGLRSTEKSAESLIKKAWSIMDAGTPREKPAAALNDRAVRAMQGVEEE